MSCDAAVSALFYVTAVFAPAEPAALDRTPAVAAAPGANPLAREPLYADIVGRAKALKAEVEAYRAGLEKTALGPLPRFEAFKRKVDALAALDMKGHLDLAARNTDGDLKCILRGISQDLPKKLEDLAAAKDKAGRDLALREMAYLLVDNVEVITAPPTPAA